MKRYFVWIIWMIIGSSVAHSAQTTYGETLGGDSNPMATPAPIPVQSTTNSSSLQYPSPNDVNTLTPIINDDDITRAILNKLKDPIYTSMNVQVTTANGVVTLDGSAKNQDQIDQAISAAKTVQGVKSVQSNMTVAP